MNNVMEQILENIDSLDNCENLKQNLLNLSKERINYFKEYIKSIKKQYMYRSNIHGIYHSEKVALYAYLIGLDQNLNTVDMEILMDAAIYHDIGRFNDFEEPFHGMVSAEKIEKVITNPIYKDSNNLQILKAIIDYHSQNDRKIRINFENYEIDEEYYDRYVKLSKILKDADALDRKRFTDKCNAALNPNFLRFDISHKLIGVSEEINKIYYKIMENENFDINKLKYIQSDCLHSIGFDFFRLISILNVGILSYKKMQTEHVTFPRNFDGGNSNQWISVVPTNLIDKEGKALKNFTKKGITFFCDTQKLYRPLEYNQKGEAISKGLPFNKSDYIDELYAFYEIPNKDIIGMFIVKEFADKDIRDVTYLYNALHYDTLKEKLMCILNNIKYILSDKDLELCKLLNEYEKITNFYEDSDFEKRIELDEIIPQKLNAILVKINAIISNLIYEYYLIVLNKNKGDKIRTIDAVKYELDTNDIVYDIIDGDEEYVFMLNNLREKKRTYKR